MLADIIQQFGQRMDMAGLCLNEEQMLSLHLENMGFLQLEYDEDSTKLFVCLSKPYPAYERDMPRKILELCGYEHEFALRGGAYADAAMLLTIMDAEQLQVAELENAILYLAAQLSKLFD